MMIHILYDAIDTRRAEEKRKIISILATPLFACRNRNHQRSKKEEKKWRPTFILTPSEKEAKNLSLFIQRAQFCFLIFYLSIAGEVSIEKRIVYIYRCIYTLYYFLMILWDEAVASSIFCTSILWLRFLLDFCSLRPLARLLLLSLTNSCLITQALTRCYQATTGRTAQKKERTRNSGKNQSFLVPHRRHK